MARYFIRLAYKGAAFHGWQIQPQAPSVQETIERSLSTVLRKEICIVGAGRTDAGVNARVMYAHFDYEEELPDKKRMLVSVNRLVGRDISIYDIFKVSDDAHARFNARERTYKYFVSFEKSPFFHQMSWYCPQRLDIDKMNEAAAKLVHTKDFTSFAKLHSDAKTNICDVKYAKWTMANSTTVVFTITADRFLRNMVRAIVGTLVEVGREKMSIEKFVEVIDRKNRCAAGQSMPGNALFLWDVKYDDKIISK